MRSKASISNSYIEKCIDKYDFKYPKKSSSRILVLGSGVDNIGNCIAEMLRECGRKVTEWSRTDGDLKSSISKLNKLYKTTDTVIMCQGTTEIDWIENQTYESICNQLNDSLYSHMLQTSEYVKNSIDYGFRKTIIYIGSMAYRNILNGSSVYCAAKAGLNMFARCMAWELAPKGYDVYMIHPGNVEDTPMAEHTIESLQRYRGMSESEARAYWNTGNPRGTILQAEDIGRLVCNICDHTLVYMSGNPIDLTGGQR